MLVMNPGFFMPYTLGVIRYKSNNKSYRFKDLQCIALYVLVNLAVAVKSTAGLFIYICMFCANSVTTTDPGKIVATIYE